MNIENIIKGLLKCFGIPATMGLRLIPAGHGAMGMATTGYPMTRLAPHYELYTKKAGYCLAVWDFFATFAE